MAVGIENPAFVAEYAAAVAADWENSSEDGNNLFQLLTWQRGKSSSVITGAALDEVASRLDGSDLAIIFAPRDQPQHLPCFPQLCSLLGIPSQFVSESLQSVTHSFGLRRLANGTHTSWLHLLSNVSSDPQQHTSWARFGVVMTVSPVPSKGRNRVVMICFEAPEAFCRSVSSLVRSNDWQDVLKDPYLLYAMVFEAWYEVVDNGTWNDIFQQAQSLSKNQTAPLAIDYERIHHIAKEALFLIEGVDAATRTLDCVSQAHRCVFQGPGVARNAVQDALAHRREVLASTRLRSTSLDQRIKNTINLAFSVRTLRDSNVMREDSYVMKTLAVLAMIFLPTSTVSSIFGMQFFNAVADQDSTVISMRVSHQFWVFWAVAIPFTSAVLIGWTFWIKRFQRRVPRVDIERGTIPSPT
ncbi:hypothetical protein V2A60_009610 [Cordyceps javanica]